MSLEHGNRNRYATIYNWLPPSYKQLPSLSKLTLVNSEPSPKPRF